MPKISGYPQITTLEDGDEFVIARGGANKRIDYEDMSAFESDILAAVFAITGAAGVFQDTGISVDLPGAGNYKICAEVRGGLKGNAGTGWWLTAELYNVTDGITLTNSERLIIYSSVNTLSLQTTIHIEKFLTVTAAKTIALYAARDGSGGASWTTSSIYSDSGGRTRIAYERL